MFPKFYDRTLADKIYLPRYKEIAEEAQPIAHSSNEKTTLFVIDAQIGFCMPGASLYVKNAENDIANICEFILKNVGKLSHLTFSLDTHYAHQIFYPCYWVNDKGEKPAPYTIISYEDVESGVWRTLQESYSNFAKSYLKQLEEKGKYKLCIWDYHTMLGGIDHSLSPLLSETAFYHCLVKDNQTHFLLKGEHPLSEHYSVIQPEIRAVYDNDKRLNIGQSRKLYFKEMLNSYDKIFIAGEASSHCVKATIEDLYKITKESNDNLISKIYILEDCMSPIPSIPGVIDFSSIAQEALDGFEKAGMHVIKSTHI